MTIELNKIAKHYGDNVVLNDVTVKINDGEFFVMVGPSGSGKSTILRMIAGLEEITEGELTIDGQRANDLLPKDRHLSMVFQNYALFPNMTVKDNILFGLQSRKVDQNTQDVRLEKALNMTGLTDYQSRFPRELSGGQRQRVALARSIVSDAQLILFDEPLSNLDAQLREQMRAEIKKLQRELNTTVIYVTHDQTEAMTMGDRVMILNDGTIQQVGTPVDLYNNPANQFVAQFFGTPKMNILSGRELANSYELANGGSVTDVWIGIRPDVVNVDAGDLTIPLIVESVANLGGETLLLGKVHGQTAHFKLAGQHDEFNEGDAVTLYADSERLHYFDINGATLKVD